MTDENELEDESAKGSSAGLTISGLQTDLDKQKAISNEALAQVELLEKGTRGRKLVKARQFVVALKVGKHLLCDGCLSLVLQTQCLKPPMT